MKMLGGLYHWASRMKRCQWAGRWCPSNQMCMRWVEKDWQRGSACFLGAHRALAGCGCCPGDNGVLGASKSPPDYPDPLGSWLLSSQPAGSYGRMLEDGFQWHWACAKALWCLDPQLEPRRELWPILTLSLVPAWCLFPFPGDTVCPRSPLSPLPQHLWNYRV